MGGDGLQHGGGFLARHENGHADAHVENLIHFLLGHGAFLAQERKDREHRPGAFADDDIAIGREDAGDIIHEAAAGDVGEAFDDHRFAGAIELLEERLHERAVADVHFHQLSAEGILETRQARFGIEAKIIEQDLAGERVAIGVESTGFDAENDVAGTDRFAIEHAGLLDDTDDGAADVVFAGLVKAGHLRCLAADQGAVVFRAGFGEAFDQVLEHFRLKFAGADVIEEKERFRAEDCDVVDAVIDQVLADRVVLAHGEGELELGADAIDAGDEDGLLVFFGVEGEEAAEAADLAEDFAAVSGGEQLGEGGFDLVPKIDIHTGFRVCFLTGHFSWRDSREIRRSVKGTRAAKEPGVGW